VSAATRPLDLTDPATVTRVARQAGLFAKRRLGQHFLVDREALDAIVEALDPAAGDTVWEIGPGIGVLTAELARHAGRVVAVDLDPACIRAARVTLRGLANVELIEGDALRADAASLGLPEYHLAAGNLPYNLTGALLGHLFEAAVPPRRGVFLVQREVAIRIASPPGGWSLATVAVRSVADVERVRDVPPGSFLPEPAVASSIIRMHPARPMPEAERGDVLRLARAAFQLRRKTLRHGLGRGLGDRADLVEAVLAHCGVDPGRRPETLDLDEWRCLARAAREMG
jgi:16S rRNA (adenine1518-N6/adenine1519-N6)-dimethyltransferase